MFFVSLCSCIYTTYHYITLFIFFFASFHNFLNNLVLRDLEILLPLVKSPNSLLTHSLLLSKIIVIVNSIT